MKKRACGLRPAACGLLVLLLVAAACGKRGAPLAPIRIVPGPVTDLTARRVGDQVQIQFKIPTENADQSAPPVISRVEIYAAPGPPTVVAPAPFALPPVPLTIPVNGVATLVASTPFLLSRITPVQLSTPEGTPAAGAARPAKGKPPATTAVAILTSKHLRGQIEVRPPAIEPAGEPAAEPPPQEKPAEPPSQETPADPRPEPGASVTFADPIAAERAGAAKSADAAILRYVVVPVAKGRRLGTPSPILELPLTTEIAPPTHLSFAYDATTLALAWEPAGPLQSFRVYLTDRDGKEAAGPPLYPAPLAVPAFSLPAEFGREACFVLRSVLVRGPASVESEAAGPICVTPVDTFPPPAPTGLSGLPTETRIQLLWNPVTAADLAGYLVLRGEDGAAPVPITTEVIPDASYTDANVRAGARYTYTVVAVDKAGNRSQPSNTVEEIR